jgi:hypothetical protein
VTEQGWVLLDCLGVVSRDESCLGVIRCGREGIVVA